MFLKGSEQLRSKIHVKLGKDYRYGVHHEFHELLDYGGSPCNNEKTYQMDACYYNRNEKQSVEGTPFGPNKTKICTNETNTSRAMDIHWNFITSTSGKIYEACYYPCSYFTISTKLEKSTYENSLESSIIDLTFEKLIQVTKSQYTYSGLSLIAEIGGYVGLFLGISVNQMPYLLYVLKNILARIHSLF